MLEKYLTHLEYYFEIIKIECLQGSILLINLLRFAYSGKAVTTGSAYEMFLLVPMTAVLPLLPLVFPVAWLCLNSYGNARLAGLQHSKHFPKVSSTYVVMQIVVSGIINIYTFPYLR